MEDIYLILLETGSHSAVQADLNSPQRPGLEPAIIFLALPAQH